MNLLIVESPGKVKKIQGFLGSGFKVMASLGHVRDLPPRPARGTGVEPPHFKPHYVATESGRDVLKRLALAVKGADRVYLATDPDREGEAIAWHLAEALMLKNPLRITFSEITEKAVKEALSQARAIDLNLVAAQAGRRVLDRLVGYSVSTELGRVVGGVVSAGRVQSPALRLVVDREKEINSFKVVAHFGVEFTFESLDNITDGWRGQWNPKNWLENDQEFFQDQATAERIASLRHFSVVSYQESECGEAPAVPFITSSLQEAASNALKFNPKLTMALAQKLYEDGHISYMRTDSPNLSEEAIADIRSLAAQNDWPLPARPRVWKSKEGAQEAHEAIRPTHVEVESAGKNDDEKSLYRLIRLRALASQLTDARYAVTTATLESEFGGQKVVVEAKGRRLISPGWRVASGNYQIGGDGEYMPANPIPKLREGGAALAMKGQVQSKKTQPPARFTEAALVKKMEGLGIGRPSTYTNILDKLFSYGYVRIEKRQLVPTQVGEHLIGVLAGRFSFLEYQFTQEMEAQLDDIAEGEAQYINVVAAAHELLQSELAIFGKTVGHSCPECGKPLRRIAKPASGKSGGYDFWGCTGFPECKAGFLNRGGRPEFKKKTA